MTVSIRLGVMFFFAAITEFSLFEISVSAADDQPLHLRTLIRFGEGSEEFLGRSFSLAGGTPFLLLEAMKNGELDRSFGKDGYLIFPESLSSSGPNFELRTLLAGTLNHDRTLNLIFSADHNGNKGYAIKLRVDWHGRILESVALFAGQSNLRPNLAVSYPDGRGIVLAEKLGESPSGREGSARFLHRILLSVSRADPEARKKKIDERLLEVHLPPTLPDKQPQIHTAGFASDGGVILWGSYYELNASKPGTVLRLFQIQIAEDGKHSVFRELSLPGVDESESHYDIDDAQWHPAQSSLDLLFRRREFLPGGKLGSPRLSTRRYWFRETGPAIKATLVFRSDELLVREPAAREIFLTRSFLVPGESASEIVVMDAKTEHLVRLVDGDISNVSTFVDAGLLTAEQLNASHCARALKGLAMLREHSIVLQE